jgi:hypothetical protein
MEGCPNGKAYGGPSGHRSAAIASVVSEVLRALSSCTSVALLDALPTLAYAFDPTALTADIPAAPLAQALEGFARQTGLQLIFVSEVLGDQRSNAVSAGLSANEALTRTLQGTGLKFEYLTARSIRILAAAAAPSREATTNVPPRDEPQEVIDTANRPLVTGRFRKAQICKLFLDHWGSFTLGARTD